VDRADRLPGRPDRAARQQSIGGGLESRRSLGRKNFLFVGNEDAGDNIAGLYSLVATCEANDVNPIDYLHDVLLRISTHPADRIDELLPDRWKSAESP
jgi:hypothetical protein